MDGYGLSDDDCWMALVKSARMRGNGLLFFSPFLGRIIWSVSVRFDR